MPPTIPRSVINSNLRFRGPVSFRSHITPFSSSCRMSVGVPSSGGLKIDSTDIKTAPGVELSTEQKTVVGSVLDLFLGRPTLAKLQLWADDATFQDPITNAVGRKHFEPQWYGLQVAFSEIERLHHEVTSAGNPITMDLKTRYKIKGIGSEQIMNSVVQITTNDAGMISMVVDRWNNKLPEGPFAKAFRNLNSVVVPAFVGVPKTPEEDAKRTNPDNAPKSK